MMVAAATMRINSENNHNDNNNKRGKAKVENSNEKKIGRKIAHG